jgi:sugar/nucleoside kinase (ribokinase family)
MSAAGVKSFDLLVLGELNPDLILRGDDPVPEFGQVEKLVDTAVLTVGSSSAILACAAARLGLRTAFAGLVGDDLLGRFMLDELDARGVDTAGCVVDPGAATGVSVILDAPASTAGRAIVTAPGTMVRFRADHIAPDLLAAARHVHCGGYFLLPALQPDLPGLFAAAGRGGATRSLDTNWDPHGRWEGMTPELLAECDLLLPNRSEALELAATRSLDAAVDWLSSRGATVAVKLGADGGLVRHRGTTFSARPPAVNEVDTTGAGDCFDAGALVGLIERWEPERLLSFAVACGALSTRAVGGTAAQPTLDEATEAAAAVAIQELTGERGA